MIYIYIYLYIYGHIMIHKRYIHTCIFVFKDGRVLPLRASSTTALPNPRSPPDDSPRAHIPRTCTRGTEWSTAG